MALHPLDRPERRAGPQPPRDVLKNGDAAETNPAWGSVLGLGFSLAFHAAPVALVVSAWGAPWWATVLLGLAGGLVFGDLAGGFMAWYL